MKTESVAREKSKLDAEIAENAAVLGTLGNLEGVYGSGLAASSVAPTRLATADKKMAAPMTAVMPIEFTALTSMPSS